MIVVLKFVCRGGDYPPVVYKNIIAFCARPSRPVHKNIVLFKRTVNLRSKYGRTVPTGFGETFDILPVGEHSICSRKERADMESTPAGLSDFSAKADRSAETYNETLFAFDVDFFRRGCYNYYGKL